MASSDLHTITKKEILFRLQAIVSNTTTLGQIIDTTNLESVEIVMIGGVLSDGEYQLDLFEGDDPNLADSQAVSAEFIIGNITDMNVVASNQISSIGYIGHKRFIMGDIVSTGVTTGIVGLTVAVIANSPRHAPEPQ